MAPIINRLETGRLAFRAASKVSSQFTPSRRMTIVTFSAPHALRSDFLYKK
jgi:hypothetical protein